MDIVPIAAGVVTNRLIQGFPDSQHVSMASGRGINVCAAMPKLKQKSDSQTNGAERWVSPMAQEPMGRMGKAIVLLSFALVALAALIAVVFLWRS